MLLYYQPILSSVNSWNKHICQHICLFLQFNERSSKYKIRKEKLSPQKYLNTIRNAGAFFSAPLRAAMTVEAAVVLPLFLFCMISIMQYTKVMETAVRLSGGLTETGKELAVAAYLLEYPEDANGKTNLLTGVLSSVYAQQKTVKKAGDTSSLKNINMALSSILKEDERIDLVMTYQVKAPVSMIHLPGTFFLQRSCVRAWTGRKSENGDGSKEREEGEHGPVVYVAETGTVYHIDENCTHLRLSVQKVTREEMIHRRNRSGARYHACERCGDHGEEEVYITNEGDRYHSSPYCSGLKRTVKEVPLEEIEDMRVCSKCGKK